MEKKLKKFVNTFSENLLFIIIYKLQKSRKNINNINYNMFKTLRKPLKTLN